MQRKLFSKPLTSVAYSICYIMSSLLRNNDGLQVDSLAHVIPGGVHSVHDGEYQLWSQSRVVPPQHTS
jgi:hypothetical protein